MRRIFNEQLHIFLLVVSETLCNNSSHSVLRPPQFYRLRPWPHPSICAVIEVTYTLGPAYNEQIFAQKFTCGGWILGVTELISGTLLNLNCLFDCS